MIKNLLLTTKSIPAFSVAGTAYNILKNTNRSFIAKELFDCLSISKKSVNNYFFNGISRLISRFEFDSNQLLHFLFAKKTQFISLQSQHNNTPIFYS